MPDNEQWARIEGGIDELIANQGQAQKWLAKLRHRQALKLLLVFVAVGVAVAAIVTALSVAGQQHQIDEILAQRTTSREVACQQYNADQLADRASVNNGVQTFLRQVTPPERFAQFAPALAALAAQVALDQKLRDCSPAGIAAFYKDKK